MNATRVSHAARPTGAAPVATKPHRVDHRDGAGHLDAAYMARLREHASDSARKGGDRAFVKGTWSSDPAAEEAAEEFVIAVTTGENAGESTLDTVTTEENGGPFVETWAATEFAYGTSLIQADRRQTGDVSEELSPASLADQLAGPHSLRYGRDLSLFLTASPHAQTPVRGPPEETLRPAPARESGDPSIAAPCRIRGNRAPTRSTRGSVRAPKD